MAHTAPLSVTFECVYELHNREEFQRDGHFVPGNCTGPYVHAITLKTPEGLQVLRALGSSAEDAAHLMQANLEQHVYSVARQQAQLEYTYEQYQALVRERGELAMFMENNYARERDKGELEQFATPYVAAMHYLRVERKRWRVRLRDWLWRRKQKPALRSDSNQWLPPEARRD